MSAGIPSPTSSSGRKTLDVELNLVPFIDLLSCLISFLLITAVWTRVSALPAQARGAKSAATGSADDAIRVRVDAAGYVLTGHQETRRIPLTFIGGRSSYDQRQLTESLIAVASHASAPTVAVNAEDSVAFADVAAAMDVVTAALPGATLLTGE